MSLILFPEEAVQGRGCGPDVALAESQATPLQLTLEINRMMEQQTLDISVWGSEDGESWGTGPLCQLPHRHYCGVYRHTLDLSLFPNIRFLRVEYNLEQWGDRAAPRMSEFGLSCEPVDVGTLAAAN